VTTIVEPICNAHSTGAPSSSVLATVI
jgi:hypothetical protein